MDLRSSHKSLRAERISGSPYRRPPPSQLKQSSSTTFSAVKNMISYALSPLFRSTSNEMTLPTTNSDLPIEVDERSESGSEDQWTGEAPVPMDGQDIFDLAAAGGRQGEDFEERAAEWRSRGEIAGGRRDLARRSLEGLPSSQPRPLAITDGRRQAVASSSRAMKRPLSPPSQPSHTTPLPTRSFLPPAATPAPPIATSASSVALTAFLDAKKGQQLTPEDFDVIDSLTNNMKAEASNSPPRQDVKYGGWSAGLSPRPVKSHSSLIGDTSRTPARSAMSTPFGTPNSTFSLGATTPVSGSPNPNAYRQRYLGPGLSPRRSGNSKSSSSLRPLFQFNSLSSDESALKKRKVEDGDAMQVDESSSSASNGTSTPQKAANGHVQETSRGLVEPANGSRRHPLSQSVTASSPDVNDPVALGKKRAADIMLALLEEEMVIDSPSKEGSASASSQQTHFEIINPYHTASIPSPQSTSSQPSTPSTPTGRRTFDSPLKPVLRSALKDTPKRGAAARLEASKAERKLTTVEKLTGVKSWDPPATSSDRHVRIETPTKEREQAERDNADPSLQSNRPSSPSRSPQPPSQGKSQEKTSQPAFKEPEPFKAVSIPTFDSPARPLPSFGSKSSAAESFDSPTQNSALAASRSQPPAPKFQLSPATAQSQPEEDEPTSIVPSAPRSSTQNSAHIYLTAKDQALKIIKEALPFYTFTLPAVSSPDGVNIVKAKEAALNAPIRAYTFSLPPINLMTGPISNVIDKSTKLAPAAEWTCDLCMLKNPATATEKCTICETPKPGHNSQPVPKANPAPAIPPSVPSTPFQWPGKAPTSSTAAGEWTCSVCMLKNPPSATEKCTICETPK